MVAAVYALALAVAVDGHEPLAEPATDLAGEEVFAPAASLHPAPVGGGELLGGDERLVGAGVPLAVEEDLAEVDPAVEDGEDGGVVDAVGRGVRGSLRVLCYRIAASWLVTADRRLSRGWVGFPY